MRAISASYVRRAKATLKLEERVPNLAPHFHVGAVNSTQRFGSSLELNVHFHSLFLDGVYVTQGPFDAPTFLPAAPLSSKEVKRVHKDIIARVRRVLVKHDLDPLALGVPPRPKRELAHDSIAVELEDSPEYKQPLLDFGDAQEGAFFPGLKAASVQSLVPFGPRAGRPLERLRDPEVARDHAAAGWSSVRVPPPLVHTSDGFSLHAATLIKRKNRVQLEKLCRYISRPAICLKRLSVESGRKILWKLKMPWRDGTKGFLMTPYECIGRLVALVPHRREHQLTYHGVLAPASPLRDCVVPRAAVRSEGKSEGACTVPAYSDGAAVASGVPPQEPPAEPPEAGAQRYIPWAELLKRVFGEDVLRCANCGGRRHMVSVVTDPIAVREVLEGIREAAAKRAAVNGGSGGEGAARGPTRAPPKSASSARSARALIPMPPKQERLDFGG